MNGGILNDNEMVYTGQPWRLDLSGLQSRLIVYLEEDGATIDEAVRSTIVLADGGDELVSVTLDLLLLPDPQPVDGIGILFQCCQAGAGACSGSGA